jgi:hypothetical protein
VLISQFNPSNPGKGMEKLLDNGDNLLTLVKSKDAIMAGSIIKAAKKRADKLTALTGKSVLPSITTQTEAQEEPLKNQFLIWQIFCTRRSNLLF